MASDIFCETIALAALFQSAVQIQSVARLGTVDEHAIAPLMRAIVITTPEEVTDVYKPQRLLTGLNNLPLVFGAKEEENKQTSKTEMVRIAYNIMALESNITKQKSVFAQLDRQIDALRDNVLKIHSDYETAPDNIILDYEVIKQYSKIYSDLISPNFPKLIIYGEEQFLRRTELQEMIRALLLAGIRASVLWNQVGGRRYSLLFKQKEIADCARKIIEDNKGNNHGE